ncbi:hypothetical protein, partial [Roseibium sediminis]|uniref:hypothetical protein n=1 Tax=Roseibium sediminis TaxID=1775174 RepID=UPI00195D2D24
AAPKRPSQNHWVFAGVQLGLYEAACIMEEVPYTKFVVIIEREYMRKYFSSIKTPNMLIRRSPFKKTPTWKNG